MTAASFAAAPGRPLKIGLWAAQFVIFVLFVLFGGMKLLMPVDQLASMWGWPGQVPAWFVHLMGAVDVAGGVGILLPAATRIQPRLSVLAALGCTLLQASAIIFHVALGQANVIPLNFILLALSLFILWGRGKRAPVLPRG